MFQQSWKHGSLLTGCNGIRPLRTLHLLIIWLNDICASTDSMYHILVVDY